jgi:hypothetical protein
MSCQRAATERLITDHVIFNAIPFSLIAKRIRRISQQRLVFASKYHHE